MSSQVNDFTWRPSTAKKMHSTNKEMQQAFIIHQNMILEPILQKTNALQLIFSNFTELNRKYL
jgi:hypothetical protein